MKLTDAIDNIIKRSNEDSTFAEYRTRAETYFYAGLVVLLKDRERFSPADYPGMVVNKVVTIDDVLPPNKQSSAWSTYTKIYSLIGVYFPEFTLDRREIIILNSIIEFNHVVQDVYFAYTEKIFMLQIADKLYSTNPDALVGKAFVTYVRPLQKLDPAIFNPDTKEELELSDSFSDNFISSVIDLASGYFEREMKGREV